jgi:3',5'-cyclic AMP phosphodiesterase CpdA
VTHARTRRRLRCLHVILTICLFTTSLAVGCSSRAETARFVVIGDFGTGSKQEENVARDVRAWVEDYGADALITTGDNIYPEGDPTSFYEAWDRPYGWVSQMGLEVVASLGNHDVQTDDGREVMTLLNMPNHWYSARVADVELFVLDSNQRANPEQHAWIDVELRESSAEWKIVVFHHPAFSCARHDSTEEVIDSWVPLFERYDVTLVLNGHDHVYQRFQTHNGVTYVVTGGGGARLYEVDRCEHASPRRVVADAERHHFVAIQVSDEALRATAIADDGTTIDEFSLPSR